MTDSLTPAERTLRARMGAYALHARHDPRVTSAPGRKAANDRFLQQVDPDGVLPEAERLRRAEAARRAHMAGLAYRSARVRQLRKAGGRSTGQATVDAAPERPDERPDSAA